MKLHRPTGRVAVGFALALSVAVMGAVASPVTAIAAEPAAEAVAPLPQPVSADGLPTVQIDGVVWKQVIVGNTVYVGGNFQNARPAGAAPGTNLVKRTGLLAYDIRTGVLDQSFNHTLNGDVTDLAASPDGKRLYAVGGFTTVDGATRNRIVAFDLPSGALSTSFAPSMNGNTKAVAATNSTVYAGGYFSAVNGSTRYRMAAMNASNGSLVTGFVPRVDDRQVQSIVVAPDEQSVVISGSFQSVNGSSNPGFGLARLTAAGGASMALPINVSQVRNAGDSASIIRLSSDSTSFYGVGWNYGGTGSTEGTFAANWSDGTLRWIEDCHGDTYDVAPVNGVVYTASHKHYCGNSGGFPQTTPWTFRHSTAFSNDVRGLNTHDPYGYADQTGQPRPELLNWYPYTEWGNFTSSAQSVWTVTGNADYVVYGGEFPSVNGVNQQGIVRYTTRAKAPNKIGPAESGATINPNVLSLASGTVRIGFTSTWDRDDETLTYRVYRDSETSTPVAQTDITTPYWKPTTRSVTDSNLTPGSTHRYRLTVTDPWGNVTKSEWVSVTVSDAPSSPYANAVLDDGATNYWRLGEPSGPSAFDWAGASTLTLGSGVTRNTAGAIGGDSNSATTFDGTTAGTSSTSVATTGPDTFSVEAWFKTTTNSGGKIVGFGDATTGTSSSYDRHIYMDNAGRLRFGVYNNAASTLNTSASYNDGTWHQVVATLGGNGMQMFVDGKRVAQRADVTFGQSYSGYWRVGGDNLNGWGSQPSSLYFSGAIDDVAVYGKVLSATQVRSHYTTSGRTTSVPAAPSDAYGKTIYGAEPDLFWRYDETSGASVADAGVLGSPAAIAGNYTRGVSGALAGGVGRGVRFSGNGGNVYSTGSVSNPTTYSLETWFRSTSSQGGKVIGLGSSQTGTSGSYDRHVYMQDNGRLVFGTWTGQENTITTTGTYNDGAWHQVVATQGSGGMALYVDGLRAGTNPQTAAQAYDGYWRVGGDTTWGSSSANLVGTFDETAVYSRVLSAADISLHFAVGTTGSAPNQPPVASFASSVNKLAATFDAAGSTDSDGNVKSYAWDFGDGGSGTGATASHTFDAPGTYSVKLMVTDDDGATGVVSKDVTVVPNVVPVAVFSSSAVKLKVSVDGSGSSDSDGTVKSYAWDFGDGGSGTGATASHTFDAPGTYSVKLTVTDDDGAKGVVSKDVTVVANQAPVAAFTSSVSGLVAAFDGSGSSDSDGSVESYAWDFGDGGSGTGATASHTFDAPGTYSVKLTVTDDDGAKDVRTSDVTVTALTVLAKDDFGRSVSSGWGSATTGGAWTLSGGASYFGVADGVGTIRMATAGSGPKAQLAGVAGADLEIRGEFSLDKIADGGGTFVSFAGRTGGFSSEYRTKVWVKSTGAVQLQLSALQTSETTLAAANVAGLSVVPGEKLAVRAQIEGSSPTTIRAKVWKVGTTEPASWQLTSTNATTQLQDAGGLGVVTSLSGSATTGASVVSFDNLWAGPLGGPVVVEPVPNVVPVAVFSSSAVKLKVSVDGSGSSDSDGTVKSYAWDFGDGGSGTGATASHTFDAPGTYSVKLTVTDDDGAKGVVSKDVTVVANQAPVAAFTSSVSGLVAAFDGSGSSDSDGSVESYAWDFGDGGSGTGATASHTFDAPGTYSVKLTVTDDDGAKDVRTSDVTVTALTVLAKDDFGRSVSSGWGSATTGGAWTLSGGASYFGVADGVGTIRMATAGSGPKAQLAGVAGADLEIRGEFSLDKIADGGGTFVSFAGRTGGFSSEYRTKVWVKSTGAVQLQLSALQTSETTLAAANVAGLSVVPGEKLAVRAQIEGSSPTTIRAKVWKVGTTEPASWQLTSTNATTQLQDAGGLGVVTSLSGSATTGASVVSFDNLWAGPLG